MDRPAEASGAKPTGRRAPQPSEAHDRGAALLAKLTAFHEQNRTGASTRKKPAKRAVRKKPQPLRRLAVAGSTASYAVAVAVLGWHIGTLENSPARSPSTATAKSVATSQPQVTKPISVNSPKAKLALTKPGIARPGVILPRIGVRAPEKTDKVEAAPKALPVAAPQAVKPPVSVLQSLGDIEYAVTPRKDVRIVRVKKGDTFMALLLRSGVPATEAHAAITSLGSVYDPRRLRPGKKMAVTFGVLGSEQGRFLGVSFDASFDRTVSVSRKKDGDFVAADKKKKLTIKMRRGEGVVETSLFQAGLRGQVPASAMLQLINLFSFDVDFQRDIQPGDSFKVMYKDYRDKKGNVVRQGDLMYAEMTLRGKTLKIYRYTPSNGRTDYFNERGESNRKALMRTPIDGARITSRFGRRRHPILGYTRLHQGADFAAPRGTPIYAAGDGTVLIAKWNGGFGRYVKIRHNADYQTAYAHMRRFANGIKAGVRVKQGQTIGYVGTTGRSTGPHLHYEVHRNGRAINPLSLKLPSGQKLKGKELENFHAARLEMVKTFAMLGAGARKVASADKSDTTTKRAKAAATE